MSDETFICLTGLGRLGSSLLLLCLLHPPSYASSDQYSQHSCVSHADHTCTIFSNDMPDRTKMACTIVRGID